MQTLPTAAVCPIVEPVTWLRLSTNKFRPTSLGLPDTVQYALSVFLHWSVAVTQMYCSKRHPGRCLGTPSPDCRFELVNRICGADPIGACDYLLLPGETTFGFKVVSPYLSGAIAPQSGQLIGQNELHRH